MKSKISRFLVLGVLLSIHSCAGFAQDTVLRLREWMDFQRAWQGYRASQEPLLTKRLEMLAKAEADADEKGKHAAFVKASDDTLDDYGKAVADAFKATVTHEGEGDVALDAVQRIDSLREMVEAGDEWNDSVLNRSDNAARIAHLKQSVAVLQRNIAISNQALTIASQKISEIVGTRTPPRIVISWAAQLEDAIRQAVKRQEDRQRNDSHRGEGHEPHGMNNPGEGNPGSNHSSGSQGHNSGHGGNQNPPEIPEHPIILH